MKQHSMRCFSPQLLMSLCSIQTLQPLFAEVQDILSGARQKKDGLGGPQKKDGLGYWGVEILNKN